MAATFSSSRHEPPSVGRRSATVVPRAAPPPSDRRAACYAHRPPPVVPPAAPPPSDPLDHFVAAVSDGRARLPGRPKRELREYASSHRKAGRIPSARASGFTARKHDGRALVPSCPAHRPPPVVPLAAPPPSDRRALVLRAPPSDRRALVLRAPPSDRRARLPGSPKRELREYASSHRKPGRIPSARASESAVRDRRYRRGIRRSLPAAGDRRDRHPCATVCFGPYT
jgi:hypothetical protein